MTTTTNEKTMIEQELATIAEIESLRAKVTESRLSRRSLAAAGDAEPIAEAQKAVEEAQAKVKRLATEKDAAKARLNSLNSRLDAGDESVSVEDVMTEEKAIERLTRLEKPAQQALQKAERALKPLVSDNHLAFLAADSLEAVTNVPVIVRKRPKDAPDFSPAVILSQTSPTEDYGTLTTSGEVKVTVVGKPDIDWNAVRGHFGKTDSEVDVSPQRIYFENARWPIPRLSKPSEGAVRAYVQDFGRAWHAQVSGAEQVARMRAAGYMAVSETGWKGLFREQGIDMTVEGGKVLAKANITVAAQRRLEELTPEGIVSNLRELVDIFQRESVGGVTGAGEIVKVSLSDEFDVIRRPVWDSNEVEHYMGNALHPITLSATVEIEFRYEEA